MGGRTLALSALLTVAGWASLGRGHVLANHFMDELLDAMRFQVSQHGLDPLNLAPFHFKVKGNGITNRDLKANFTKGSLLGLALLKRQGDCAYGTFGAEMKMGCYVSLYPVYALMDAQVKGDHIIGGSHSLGTQTNVLTTTLALVEVRGRRGVDARLDAISLPQRQPVALTTSVVRGELDLNASRFSEFIERIHENFSNQLVLILDGVYAHALRAALTKFSMP